MKKMRHVMAVFILICLLIPLSACSKNNETEIFTQFSDLNGRKIGALSGSIHDDIINRNIENAEILHYDEDSAAVMALKSGDIDAYSMASIIADSLLKHTEGLAKFPEPTGNDVLAFILPKGSELNAAVSTIIKRYTKDGTLDALYEKWVSSNTEPLIDYSKYSFDDRGNGVLRIVFNPLLYPLNFVGGDGDKLEGYEVELIYMIADELGMGIEFSRSNLGSLVAYVSQGKADIGVGSLIVTDERKESVDFAEPIADVSTVLLCREENISAQTEDASSEGGFFADIAVSFEKTFLRENRWKLLASGLLVTLEISLLSCILGTVLAFPLSFALRSRCKAIACPMLALCTAISRIPNLVTLMIIYFVVFATSNLSPVSIGIVSFAIIFAISFASTLNAGINALDVGQSEAATALGFDRMGIFIHVVAPQALRNILPLYKGEVVALIKATSVVGYIAIQDLTRAGDLIRSRTYEAFFPLITTALLYFMLISFVIFLISRLETILKLNKQERKLPKGVVDSGNITDRMQIVNGGSCDEEMIRIEHLKKVYPDSTPISDANAIVKRGEIITIIGPSGTGKSTLLRCIDALEKPTEGKVFILGQELEKGNLCFLRRRMGMVFQSFYLFDHLNVLNNIMLAPVLLKKQTKQEAYEKAMALLRSMGLEDRALHYPSELSGGQKQRIAIARALAMEPEILLLDEPTSALDPTMVDEVQAVIRKLAEQGLTMMIVTHEMRFAREISTRIFYMDQGIVYEDGSPEQIFDHPQKNRTHAFVERLKVLSLKIDGPDFDFIDMTAKLMSFAEKHRLSHRTAMHLSLAFEELLGLGIVPETSEAPLTVLAEYSDRNHELALRLIWKGEAYNPIGDGDETPLKLLRGIIASSTHSYQDGENRLELIIAN